MYGLHASYCHTTAVEQFQSVINGRGVRCFGEAAPCDARKYFRRSSDTHLQHALQCHFSGADTDAMIAGRIFFLFNQAATLGAI
jgi:hypothetical protein